MPVYYKLETQIISMRKTFFLSLALLLSFVSFSQVNLQSLLKPGAKLVYAVEANEQKDDFSVTIKALTPALVFDVHFSILKSSLNSTTLHVEKCAPSTGHTR